MAERIVMPSLGMYEAEGTLVKWLLAPGTEVKEGDPVAELQTEKSSVDIQAPASGRLHPVAEEGASLKVESLVGYILQAGEEAPATVPRGAVAAPAASPERASSGAETLKASPIARRLAREYGVDLERLAGSGPGGRIVEADVRAAAKARPAGADERNILDRTPLSGMRGTIAQRLRASLSTAASLTLTREVDAAPLTSARALLAERLGLELPYDALFIKLLAAALRERPTLNAIIEADVIVTLGEIHVGFAVAVPGGLVVPVVRDADRTPLAEVARAVRDLAQRAGEGRLHPGEMAGGTASISNLGAYGIDAFTPILNPPQSVILGIGRIAPRPVVRDGQVVAGRTTVLSLTFDHRVADGAPAAELLAGIASAMTAERLLLSWA